MKILIIEDQSDLSNDIKQYLETEHYLCEQAFTYNEAVEKLELYDYDCIVLDLMLPDGNGLELLNVIRNSHDKSGVIIASAKDALFDIVINNLVVNAIRHNAQQGTINVVLHSEVFSVSNTAKAGALHKDKIFSRFYKPDGEMSTGNGLGLAIVKSICDYYGWSLNYDFTDGSHVFSIKFSQNG